MKRLITIFILIAIFCKSNIYSQGKFRQDFTKSNPVQFPSKYNNQQTIQIHEKYLKKAIENKDIKEQFYGQLYLYNDHINYGLYVEATKYLLEVEKLAKINKTNEWLTELSVEKGYFDLEVHQDYNKAIKHYFVALDYALKSTDSLCIGEVYEQLSSAYDHNKDFVNAKKYFDLALPLIKKYGSYRNLGIIYNNYANFWVYQNKFKETKQYIDSAIFYARKSNDLFSEMKYKVNLSSTYIDEKEYSKVIDFTLKIEPIIKSNFYNYLLVICYDNLSNSYEKLGNFKASSNYYKKYYVLRDSLNGSEVKNKLSTYTSKIEKSENEIALKTAKIVLQKRNFQIILFGLIFLFFLLFWLFQHRKNKRKLKHNQESLNDLTKILLEKNSQLSMMESLINNKESEVNTNSKNDFVENMYEGKILTNDDWELFKAKFEKVYPNFIYKIRQKFDSISEAEERLFVFIKLNLKSKEIASILGINAESIKRTRNRLRKRLELTEDENLDGFVHKF